MRELPCVAGPSVTAGMSHNCASKPSSGQVTCWGMYHQKAPTQVNLVPEQFAAVSWSVVNAGDDFSCGIMAGTSWLFCGGPDGDKHPVYPLPDDAFVAGISYSAVSAGYSGTCALKSGSGLIQCKGGGHNNPKPWGSPGDPPGYWNQTLLLLYTDLRWTSISVGSDFACGIVSGSGEIHCWPPSTAQTTPPTTYGWSTVSSGVAHACGLLGPVDNRTMRCCESPC